MAWCGDETCLDVECLVERIAELEELAIERERIANVALAQVDELRGRQHRALAVHAEPSWRPEFAEPDWQCNCTVCRLLRGKEA